MPPMSNRTWRDEEEDWSETDDAISEDADADHDDADDYREDESFPCPECRAEIYPDLDRCPQCGRWLTDADREPGETGMFASRRVSRIAAVLLAIFVLSLIAEHFFLG